MGGGLIIRMIFTFEVWGFILGGDPIIGILLFPCLFIIYLLSFHLFMFRDVLECSVFQILSTHLNRMFFVFPRNWITVDELHGIEESL